MRQEGRMFAGGNPIRNYLLWFDRMISDRNPAYRANSDRDNWCVALLMVVKTFRRDRGWCDV